MLALWRTAMGAAIGRGAGPVVRAGAAGAAAVARAGLGAWVCTAATATGAGPAVGPPVGPPGGRVGSLMVGAAVGLGGKLMRTVSFLGWTLPVSFFGGTAPLGIVGMFSAINLISVQTRIARCQCQTLKSDLQKSLRVFFGARTGAQDRIGRSLRFHGNQTLKQQLEPRITAVGTTDFTDFTDKEGIAVQGMFTRRVAAKEVLDRDEAQCR